MTSKDETTSDAPGRVGDNVLAFLRGRIEAGDYSDGEWLPTERALAESLGVHRIHIRYALDRLEAEGLVERRPRCRPVVRLGRGPAVEAVKSTSRDIALVMWHGDINDQSPSALQTTFWGAVRALGAAGYHPVILNLGDYPTTEAEDARREEAHLRHILSRDIAGVLFYPYAYRSNHSLIRAVARKVPLVFLDRVISGVEADFAGCTNFEGVYDATRHLISMGHTRIAYVTTPEPINPVQDRLRGYLHALADNDPPLTFEAVVTAPSRPDLAWSTLRPLFSLPAGERPTAIVCVNDHAAYYVAGEIEAMGLTIPADVSVIGFDDVRRTLPSGVGLSSVVQPFAEIGKAAAELVIRRIEKPGAPWLHREVPTTLAIRESVRALS